jgi:hypothetical protein
LLTPEQNAKFWPLYDDYQIHINKFNAERKALLTKFAVNLNRVSDDLAQELIDKAIDLEKQRLDLKKRLVETFSKKFPPTVVARYYQIENKLDAMVMSAAAENVPLVKEQEKQ